MSTRHTAILGNLHYLPPRLRFWQRSAGLGELILWLGAWTLGAFTLDWVFELPRLVRGGLLLAGAVACVALYLRARRRWRQQFAMDELAAAVEGTDPEIDGHLLNVLEIPEELRRLESNKHSVLEQKLLRRALDESCAVAGNANLGGKLDLAPVVHRVGLAAGLFLVVMFLAALAPSAFGLWLRRGLLLSGEAWPRQTHFLFDRAEDVWHVARKDALEIGAWVTGVAPRQVQLRLHSANSRRDVALVPGSAGSVPPGVLELAPELRSAPDAQAAAATGRRLLHTLPALTEDLTFHLVGGDNTSRQIQVHAHDRPRILATRWVLRFPSYLARDPQTIENPGSDVPLPQGTVVEFEAEADQELESAWFRYGAGERQAATVDGSSARGTFTPRDNGFLDLGVMEAVWKLESDPSLRVAFVVLPDRSPTVSLAIEGDSRKVTPQGRVRHRVVAEDDHALSGLSLKTWLRPRGELRADDELEPQTLLLEGVVEKTDTGVRATAEGETLVASLGLAPGAEFTLQAVVADNDTVTGPKLAASQKETFQIVDPEDFRQEMERVRLEAQATIEDLARREDELAVNIAQQFPEAAVEPGERSEVSTERLPGSRQASNRAKGAKAAKSSPQDSPGEEPADTVEAQETEDGSKAAAGSRDKAAREGAARKAKSKKAAAKAAANAAVAKPNEAEASEPEEAAAETEPGAAAPADDNETEVASTKSASPSAKSPSAKSSKSKATKSAAASASTAESPPEQQAGETEPDSAEEPPSDEVADSTAGEKEDSGAQALAEEQKRIAREAQKVSERLRAMAQGLRDNNLLDPAEAGRLNDEVSKPLDDLAEERLPQSAEKIEALAEAETPAEETRDLQRGAERMSDELRQVARKLAGTGDFREILQRMEMIIDLQKKSIGETEKIAPIDRKPLESSPQATDGATSEASQPKAEKELSP